MLTKGKEKKELSFSDTPDFEAEGRPRKPAGMLPGARYRDHFSLFLLAASLSFNPYLAC